jgi:site-specific recombinase XerD
MIISMRRAGIKPVSVNTYLSFLNAFLRWLFEEGYVTTNHRLKKLKAELKAVKIFKDDEVHRIINYKPNDYCEWRLWVMMCLLLGTGIRSSECTGLTIKDVNMDQLYISVHGKGRRIDLFRFLKKCGESSSNTQRNLKSWI